MRKYRTEQQAREAAILAANIYGGTWGVIKYPHSFGVARLQSDIRLDPSLTVIFKAGPIF